MVDKLIVQLQDTSRILRSSCDESVTSALRNALRCINDADKLKQVRSEKNELDSVSKYHILDPTRPYS